MFKKVLIVEDLDTVGYGIKSMLENELGIPKVVITQYCDDAYLKVQSALLKEEPFDLLITDLHFREDHRTPRLTSGRELIEKCRDIGVKSAIIVFTVEDRTWLAHTIVHNNKAANGYVIKGRKGLKELQEAIRHVYQGEPYFSTQVRSATPESSPYEIEEYEVQLLNCLSQGLRQDEISRFFSNRGIHPSSLSSIEKRINKLKDLFGATNNVHLISIAKDLGVI